MLRAACETEDRLDVLIFESSSLGLPILLRSAWNNMIGSVDMIGSNWRVVVTMAMILGSFEKDVVLFFIGI